MTGPHYGKKSLVENALLRRRHMVDASPSKAILLFWCETFLLWLCKVPLQHHCDNITQISTCLWLHRR